jgi:hypothetical protein
MSATAALKFADGSLDFVYLDALHSYRDCMNDILSWFPKVRRVAEAVLRSVVHTQQSIAVSGESRWLVRGGRLLQRHSGSGELAPLLSRIWRAWILIPLYRAPVGGLKLWSSRRGRRICGRAWLPRVQYAL